MITPMYKYTFLVYHKEYTSFLKKIQEKGALHVIEKPQAETGNDEMQRRLEHCKHLKEIISSLEFFTQNKKTDRVIAERDDEALIQKADALFEERDQLLLNQQLAEKEIEKLEPWGEFDRKKISKLHDAGYQIRFYSCNKQKFRPEWENEYNAIEIDSNGSVIWFITVTKDIDFSIEADRLTLPKKSLSELLAETKLFAGSYKEKTEEISRFALAYTETFKAMLNEAGNEYSFAKVYWQTTTEADDKVMILQGWVPEDAAEEIDAFLEQEHIYYEKNKPEKSDKVPIKLKNNYFARLFESIAELYEMPNYHEVDLTPFFAPFFMLFFGLCLGDAGYGLLIVIAAIIFMRRAKPSMKPILSLAIFLGSGAVILGFLSGTFLGIDLKIVDWEWLRNFKKIMLNSDQLFNLALIIGAVQIIFGMFIRAIGKSIRSGFLSSLRDWGWLIMILGVGGCFGLVKTGLSTAEQVRIPMIVFGCIAVLFIFLLNNTKRNPLINIGAGLWDSYNTATGLLGDILSYIRLFALGISGSVMGFVFNNLAFSLSGDIPVVSQIVMIFILFFGHSLNIFMSGLGAFVHPMRLTFVEFYKNAGFEGGGKKYIPFSKN